MSETPWPDQLKDARDDPDRRYAIAVQYLPYPAAFKEAAIALRAMIQRGDVDGRGGGALAKLYRLAALHDFFFAKPHLGPEIGPAFNVAEAAPPAVWRALEFPYAEVGYAKLSLLSKTDRKRLVAKLGEPRRHRSAQAYHHETWRGFVEECRRGMRERTEEFERQMQRLLEGS